MCFLLLCAKAFPVVYLRQHKLSSTRCLFEVCVALATLSSMLVLVAPCHLQLGQLLSVRFHQHASLDANWTHAIAADCFLTAHSLDQVKSHALNIARCLGKVCDQAGDIEDVDVPGVRPNAGSFCRFCPPVHHPKGSCVDLGLHRRTSCYCNDVQCSKCMNPAPKLLGSLRLPCCRVVQIWDGHTL